MEIQMKKLVDITKDIDGFKIQMAYFNYQKYN